MHREMVLSPFLVTDTAGRFSVMATAKGGGMAARLRRHGIATACRGSTCGSAGAVKAGSRRERRRERLKPGQPGASKQPPWVKR